MPWTTTDEFNVVPKTQRMSLASFPGHVMLWWGKVPEDWSTSWVNVYKGKGDALTWTGIKLLEHAMKVLEKVIEGEWERLQFGFMAGWSTSRLQDSGKHAMRMFAGETEYRWQFNLMHGVHLRLGSQKMLVAIAGKCWRANVDFHYRRCMVEKSPMANQLYAERCCLWLNPMWKMECVPKLIYYSGDVM